MPVSPETMNARSTPDRVGDTRIFVPPSPSPRSRLRRDDARWRDPAAPTGFGRGGA